jgi:hypothetical protein
LDYPYYLVLSQGIPRGMATQSICLVAGVHGDEPAGVEAVVRFLENKPFLDGVFLTVIPCLNPVGYDRGTRENRDGVDLNRQFHPSNSALEATWVHRALSGYRYDLFICCHDDNEANGFYLYEAKRGKKIGFGPSIISTIREVAPIDRRPKIDGRINHEGILVPTNWRSRKTGWSLALYLYRLGTPHCLIFETPTFLPFEEQVSIHMRVLDHLFSFLVRGGKTESRSLTSNRKRGH